LADSLPLEADLFHNERPGACQLKERRITAASSKDNDPAAKVKGGRAIAAPLWQVVNKTAADRYPIRRR
jgi:hypothetical protein